MQGTRRGPEGFGGPVKTGRAGSLGGGACGPGGPPSTEQPPRGELAEEGGKEKFLARQRQLRAAPCIGRGNPGCYGAGHGVSSQPKSRAEAKGAGCPLLPVGPGASAGTAGIGQRRAGLGADGRALAAPGEGA